MDPSRQEETHERDRRDIRPPHGGDASSEDNDEDNDEDPNNDKVISQSEWPLSQNEKQKNKNDNIDNIHESGNEKNTPEPSMDFLNNSPDDTPQEAHIFSSSPPPPTPKTRPLPRKAPIAAIAPAFAYEEDENDEIVGGEESLVPATMPKSPDNTPPHQQQEQEDKTDTAEIPATAHQVREDKKGHHSDDDHESVPETQLEPEVNAPDNVPASSPSTITSEPHSMSNKGDKDNKDDKDVEYYRVDAESALMMDVDDENIEEEVTAEEMTRPPTPPDDIIPHDFIPEHPPQSVCSLVAASTGNYNAQQPPRDDDQLSDNGDKDIEIRKGYVKITCPATDPKLKEKRSKYWQGVSRKYIFLFNFIESNEILQS